MRNSAFIIGAALVLAPLSASGAPGGHQPGPGFPVLSGNYLLQQSQFCQPTLNVSIDPNTNLGVNVVTGVTLQGNSASGTVGAAFTATQNQPKGSGTISYSATQSQGDPIVTQNIGVPGESGTPLSVGSGTGSVTFVQTATTLALTDQSGTSTYILYYGVSQGKKVGTAVFAGLNNKGCSVAASIIPAD